MLAAAVLNGVDTRLDRWRSAGGDPDASGLRPEYERRCGTLGRSVRAELADGGAVIGTAVAVAADGGLVIDVQGRRRTVAAADVHHLRPASHP
jgi:BirA family biotin operon repressor/biotin-[acetyl-CoA-carboxylase] ligase